MTGRWIRWSAATLVLLLAAPAWAQTADGVGRGTDDDEEPLSAEDAAQAAQDLISLAEYERKFYQVGLRMWPIFPPRFVLDAFFSRHTNPWGTGDNGDRTLNFAYGAEFTTRIPEKYDLVISLDWANLRTPDGWWLEDGDSVADANWTENTISLLTADVGFHWLTPLDRLETLQLYYGIGLGASIVLGEFNKYDVDTDACGNMVTADDRNSRNTSMLDACFDDDGNPTHTGLRETESKVPPVLPSLSGVIGLRYLIADRVSIALEGGLKAPFFYGGLEIGYFWETAPPDR